MQAHSPEFKAKVRAWVRLGPRASLLQLEVDPPIRFEPGQFVGLFAGAPATGPHYYSIASSAEPEGAAQIEFCVGLEAASSEVTGLVEGNEVGLSRPQGGVPAPLLDAPELILVGAGTGVAPLRSIARTMRRGPKRASRRITFVSGQRSEADQLFHDELLAEEAQGAFHYLPVLSRIGTSSGAPARVQDVVGHLLARGGAEAAWVVCGSAAMVADVKALLLSSGVSEAQVHAEGY